MWFAQIFPAPVSLEDDEEGALIVHRNVALTHTESRQCACCPQVFTQDELQRHDFRDKLNAQLRTALN